jgi:phosphopantetheine--protein transferase-like protein
MGAAVTSDAWSDDMPYTVGVDLEPVSRFAEADPRLFTVGELAAAERHADPAESRAGRWCAKEAVVKACSKHVLLATTEIEVVTMPDGRPVALLPPRASALGLECDVSISHADGFAMAVAIATRRSRDDAGS